LKEFWARKKWKSRIDLWVDRITDEKSGVEFRLKVEEVCKTGGPTKDVEILYQKSQDPRGEKNLSRAHETKVFSQGD
jgi:hypothetical protein